MPASPEQPILGTALTADTLRQLPVANNPLAVLDVVQTETIGDRFLAAGLGSATPPHTGGFLNSWTQTQFRIGDITITDPRTGGSPLLLPFLPMVERVTVATGAMGVDDNASALSMVLEPLRPGATWRRAVEGSFSGGPLVADGETVAPAIDRVDRTTDGHFLIGGPVSDRVGLAAAASWRGLSHIAAPAIAAATDRVATGFVHLVFKTTPSDELRAIGSAQRATTDAFRDTAVHVQSTWERRNAAPLAWRVFAGYTERKRSAPAPSTIVVDSLTSDPVSDLFDTGAGTSRRWTIGARVAPAAARLPTLGVDIDNGRVRVVPTGVAEIRERLDGAPARMWTIQSPATSDFRHQTTVAAHANEHLTYGPVTIDAGVRLEIVRAAADAASAGIEWTTWLPRAMAEWQLTRKADVALLAGYRRSAYQLPLNVLAIGDPAAPVADVARWNGSSAGALIARVGPGTGGDAAFSQIDPNLRRPTTDELTLAVRTRPFRGFEVELARVTKREQPLIGLLDTGVPASSYSSIVVPDSSFMESTAGRFDEPFVTALNRPPGSYGRDRYLLTNRTGDPAESWGLELNLRWLTPRMTLLFGGALTWAYGPAAAVGFLSSENDQNVLGNFFVDANSANDARGQLFQDRSHVVKIAGIYRFPRGITLGAIARYQDGQPFARLVIVPGLTQGPSAVRSYRNGGAAFTYTGTLDVRLQREFTSGPSSVTVGVDVYNLPGMGKEVSEYVVAGPRFRTPTMVQPPRSAVVNARVVF